MTFKKLSCICIIAILFVFGAYIYGSSKEKSDEPIAATPQVTHETRVVAKESDIAKDKKVVRAKFKPIAEQVPAPEVEPEVDQKVELSWKEEQALRQAKIDRLEALKKSFPRDSKEYREIEDQIYLELEEMGLTVYETENGGGVNHTPNYEWISEISKRFDPEMQHNFSNEISAVEELVNQREKIDAEMNANRRGELENTPELIERDQKLVAQEFRFAREHPEFFEELEDHATH
jgi:hypothetical protein